MSRSAAGELEAGLRNGDDPRIAKVAAIVRAVDPDVILINEFDYGAGHDRIFVENYLDGAWPFSFIAPSNTGVATGHDLDGDGIAGSEPGTIELARDSHGFGTFEGQYGMVVLSRHEIAVEEVRTFRTFLWKDMPGARLPARPDGTSFLFRRSAGGPAPVLQEPLGRSRADRRRGCSLSRLSPHPTRLRRTRRPERRPQCRRDSFWSDYAAGRSTSTTTRD